VVISVERTNDEILISVTDNGEGIPADVLPRIFEPHFSTRTSGSGLGLAISRRLVDSWGGTIVVESDRGRGTVVRVVLRAAPT
jgi:signal transduction histidine kinase